MLKVTTADQSLDAKLLLTCSGFDDSCVVLVRQLLNIVWWCANSVNRHPVASYQLKKSSLGLLATCRDQHWHSCRVNFDKPDESLVAVVGHLTINYLHCPSIISRRLHIVFYPATCYCLVLGHCMVLNWKSVSRSGVSCPTFIDGPWEDLFHWEVLIIVIASSNLVLMFTRQRIK